MRTSVLSPLLLAVATGALAAGCATTHGASPADAPATSAPAGSTAAATRAAGTPDPCTLLTTGQVSAALGQPPAAGKHEPSFDAPECEWDPASGQNGTVTLGVGPWDGDPGVKPLRLGTPVSGVGDAAYDGGNTGLYVRKGTRGVRVWVFNVSTQSSRLDLEKQLAAIVLAEI